MLKLRKPVYYQVKKGQTVREIACAFCVGERILVQENCLSEEVYEGQILRLPSAGGNLYTAKAGEDETLLCGSVENYRKKNGGALYPGKRVVL